MKPTSRELLEEVSKHCSNQLTLYKFNTSTLKVNKKYREGRLTALEYLGELTYYFLQEEKKIQQQFRGQILKQMELNSCLEDTEYKKGLYDALEDALTLQNIWFLQKILNRQFPLKKIFFFSSLELFVYLKYAVGEIKLILGYVIILK